MDNQDLQYFINYLFHNKRLTEKQIKKRNYLLSKTFSTFPVDVEQGQEGSKHEINENAGGATKTVTTKTNETNVNTNMAFVMLFPLDTASFLSKFNDPFGLKYLTHDFDTPDDGRPHTIEELIIQVNHIFKEKQFTIPTSLWTLVNGFCSKGNWFDTFGKVHESSLNDTEWRKWSEESNHHPINNPVFEKEIMTFRSTVRVVPPNLQTMCQKAMKGSSLQLEQNKLEKADFYTNTHTLYFAIKRIIRTMNTRSDKYPHINISYERSTDAEGKMLRHVVITQLYSCSDKSIEDVVDRLNRDPEAGDFGAIRKMLNGYCYWQVESAWDNQPKRWNILRTSEMPEVEDIENDSIVGFKHILTFYIV